MQDVRLHRVDAYARFFRRHLLGHPVALFVCVVGGSLRKCKGGELTSNQFNQSNRKRANCCLASFVSLRVVANGKVRARPQRCPVRFRMTLANLWV
jgi:hypothetical protein